ncbi:MAG TPA: DUF5104 domain-containing protein [Candidatus Scybalocola faecavium]|nr:DUF5104 domain-containing protein [Candidatus Scybalocola faecavium]
MLENYKKSRMGLGIMLVFLIGSLIFSSCSFVKSTARKAADKARTILSDTFYGSEEATLYDQAVDDFFHALDQKDADGIYEMFAPNVREASSDLKEKIQELFKAYPGTTDICKRDGSKAAGEYSHDSGKSSAMAYSGFPVVSGDTDYWCMFTLMYENDWDENEVGIRQVRLYSIEYRCKELYETQSADPLPEDEPLLVLTDCDIDYEVRLIGGYPYKYTPADRELTVEQVREYFQGSDSYLGFLKQFGPPDAKSTSLVSCFYTLPAENGEPRYLDLLFSEEKDQIYRAAIVNDLDVVAVEIIYDQEES